MFSTFARALANKTQGKALILLLASLLTACSLQTMEAGSAVEPLPSETIATRDDGTLPPDPTKNPTPSPPPIIVTHDDNTLLPDPTKTSTPSPFLIIVTRDDETLPSGCTPLEIAQFILGFFDAFNQGDQEQLANMFLLGDNRWYSVDGANPDTNFVAYDLKSLLIYFGERHQHQERLQLMKVNVSYPSWHGGADIAFVVKRTADDIEPGIYGPERFASGKGAIYCTAGKIMVWSMGMPPPDIQETSLPTTCPTPPPDSPKNAVIACVRGK